MLNNVNIGGFKPAGPDEWKNILDCSAILQPEMNGASSSPVVPPISCVVAAKLPSLAQWAVTWRADIQTIFKLVVVGQDEG